MKLFLHLIAGSIFTFIILSLAYVIYDTNTDLRMHKRALFGIRQDYQDLLIQNAAYLNKLKSMRQITVFAATPNSSSVDIGNTLSNYAKKINGDVSIYYKNITTGESVIVEADKTYYMASLYKVILTLYILNEVKNGKISLKDTIGNSKITLDDALNKIITESNNEYAQMLAEKYGWLNIQTAMEKKLGIDFSFDKTLEINVTNVGRLFEEIATSLNISELDSKYLLKLLNDQKKTEKLPKYLPKTVYSHNKTGEFESYSHDAAIFYTPKANYILVVMSKTKDTADTNEQMALLSYDIYNILNPSKK